MTGMKRGREMPKSRCRACGHESRPMRSSTRLNGIVRRTRARHVRIEVMDNPVDALGFLPCRRCLRAILSWFHAVAISKPTSSARRFRLTPDPNHKLLSRLPASEPRWWDRYSVIPLYAPHHVPFTPFTSLPAPHSTSSSTLGMMVLQASSSSGGCPHTTRT